MEEIERPSFENFLSKPTTLTDHLAWQLGALSLRREVREAAEQIIGNLNEDGYLIASDEEMLGVAPPATPEADAAAARNIVSEAQALGLDETADPTEATSQAESFDAALACQRSERNGSCRLKSRGLLPCKCHQREQPALHPARRDVSIGRFIRLTQWKRGGCVPHPIRHLPCSPLRVRPRPLASAPRIFRKPSKSFANSILQAWVAALFANA